MMTVGLISLTLYLLIIIGHWIFKFASKNIGFSSIFVLCFFGLITLTHSVVANDQQMNFVANIIDYVTYKQPLQNSCSDAVIYRNASKDTIILRLDDVHDFYKSEITQRIIVDTTERDLSLVAGVIPIYLSKDIDMIRVLQQNTCAVEIAQHGFDHSLLEFEHLDYESATRRIQDGMMMIESLFDQTPQTFIPPYNVYSEDTAKALHDNNFAHISSQGTWRFDHAAMTVDQNGKLTPIDVMMTFCEQKFIEHEPCVIMIHPQDYATNDILDEMRYQNYTDLLDYIEENDIQTSTIKDY